MKAKRVRALLLQVARLLRWAADAVAKLAGVVVVEKKPGENES